jgi:ADP-dependent phosphofructokinase/glucokinase
MNAQPRAHPDAAAWHAAYAAMARELPQLAALARPLVAGFAACVDKRIDLHALAPALAGHADPSARRFLDELLARAAIGRGGEIAVDWPEGPAVLDGFALHGGTAVGGTSAQAAWTHVKLGAPAILALADHSAGQLAVLDPRIQIVDGGCLMPVAAVRARGTGKPAHYIVEYTAGRPLLGLVPARSTRVIVRFADEDIEHDAAFVTHVRHHARDCGAALIASPNALPPERLPLVLDEMARAADAWRAAGTDFVHLEFGDFAIPGTGELTLAWLAPHVTSVGLNLNELRGLMEVQGQPVERLAVALGERLGVARVVVHGDAFALAVTRGDAWRECEALLAGCLVASARAASGSPCARPAMPDQAVLSTAPAPAVSTVAGWSVACCPAPYLAAPASTVGLGDSFTAGTLLIHSLPPRTPMLPLWLGAENAGRPAAGAHGHRAPA